MDTEKKLILCRLTIAVLMTILVFHVGGRSPCEAREIHPRDDHHISLVAIINDNVSAVIPSDLETGFENPFPPAEYLRDNPAKEHNDDPGTRTVRVGIYQNPPKIFIDERGLPAGIFVDLLNEIAKKENWTLIYVPCKWSDCLEDLEEYRIDLMPDVAYSPERDEKYDFHETPVVDSWSQVYANASTRVSTLSDLDGRRIAVLKKGIQEGIFEQMMNGFGYTVTFVEAETYEEAFFLAHHGYADAVLSNHFIGDYLYQNYELKKTPVVLNPSSLYFATAQGRNPELLSAIERNLDEWRSQPDSYYYRTLAGWSEKPPEPAVPRYIIWIIVITAGFLVLSAGIILLLRGQVRAKTKHLIEANESIRKSEEKYRLLVENLNDVIFNLDAQGNITYISPVAEGIFDYSIKEVIGKPFSEYIHADDLPGLIISREETTDGVFNPYEFRMIDRGGSIHHVRTSSRPIERNGRHVGMTGVLTDITGEKQAEQALRKSEEMYRTILHTMEDGYFEVDLRGRFTSFNESMREMLGYDPEEIVGLNYRRYMTREIAKKASLTFHEVFRTGVPAKTAGWRLNRKDGTTIEIETSISLKRNNSGDPVGFFGIARDITERKLAEEALKESEELFRNMFHYHAAIKLIIDPDTGSIVDANEAAANFYGWSIERLKQMKIQDINTLSFGEIKQEMGNSRGGERASSEFQHRRADGSTRDVEVFSSKIEARGKELLHSVIHDITDRKRYEEALRESEEKFRNFFETSRDVIYISDVDGIFIDINPAMRDLFGYKQEEIIGQPVQIIYRDPDEYKRFQELITREGFVKDLEIIYRDRDGIDHFCLETATVRRDGSGNIIGYQGFIRDNTERVHMQEQLIQAEKLSSLGGILSGVAHELNNPLTAIIGNAQLLLRQEVTGEIKQKLDTIYTESFRCTKIVGGLLAFAREHKPERIMTDINKIIMEAYTLREYELRVDDVSLKTELDETTGEISIDPYQIQQVLMNLINNAHHALRDKGGGNLMIKSRREGNSVVIECIDDGPGIPDEIKWKIFDPFFTTKETGEGTGLGLSVCYGIVKEHNGSIEVESHPGFGTRFIVSLPISVEGTSESESVSSKSIPKPEGTVTVLVIEDEQSLRRFISDALQAEGYTVTSTESADRAVEILKDEQFDTIISDMKMPGMSGQNFYTYVQKYYPHLAENIIFITGDVLGKETQNFFKITGCQYIEKPFEIDDLMMVLGELLQRKRKIH
ncbi:MAG: PAS domain S-box protein [Deltaproteobacteria bacterium]|nr:PAS domain S-box protein [Candidatus Zymogenaceae bacterium]